LKGGNTAARRLAPKLPGTLRAMIIFTDKKLMGGAGKVVIQSLMFTESGRIAFADTKDAPEPKKAVLNTRERP
jgi:hypothetical protein